MFKQYDAPIIAGILTTGLLLVGCGGSSSSSPFTPADPGFEITSGEDIAFSGPEGGPFQPNGFTITLSNTGDLPLDWTVSVTDPWLEVTDDGGQIPARGTGGTTFNVDSVSAASFTAGNYSTMIVFQNLAVTGDRLEVQADLRITSNAVGGGLFIDAQGLNRVRARAQSSADPFASSYATLQSKAQTALNSTADPFHMDDITQITFAWCGQDTNNIDDSLKDACNKFEKQADWMRSLALEYAVTGDTAYADKARDLMLAWAADHTPVNLHDFNIDYATSYIDGKTSGMCSHRPWNFALDAMWQTYGLINSCDAYLLLTRNGYTFSTADDDTIQLWLRAVTEAVNSSFHAWTRWADTHPNSGSLERYRTDNHLSWCLAGLLAAGVALDDAGLRDYCLFGGAWFDTRGGLYANPSHIHDVIDRAVESGTGSTNEGRVYEERIMRNPPIGYALFHLHAMELVARIAEVHGLADVWGYTGTDGGGLWLAFDRYSDFILGNRISPAPSQEGDLTARSHLYEMVYAVWPEVAFEDTINTTNRLTWFRQAVGPVVLLVGEDLP